MTTDPSTSEVAPASAPRSFLQELSEVARAIWSAPWTVRAFAIVLVILYAPIVAEAAKVWVKDDKQAHGVFIFPIVLFLLWLLRADIRAAAESASARPAPWGLLLLVIGLLLEVASYLLRIKWFPMLSMIPVLVGAILVLQGVAVWRVVAFPVLFLFFAAPLPDAITLPTSARIQRQSTDCAVWAMTTAGFPILQMGNRIDTATCSVEVAEVCSGFKKLTALIAFAFLYGFMFPLGMGKRMLLVASAYPIALFANVVRICALIGVGSTWGEHALHTAHDSAELAVLVVSFGLFVVAGKAVGCRNLRFLA